jgi:hypothetical protein
MMPGATNKISLLNFLISYNHSVTADWFGGAGGAKYVCTNDVTAVTFLTDGGTITGALDLYQIL